MKRSTSYILLLLILPLVHTACLSQWSYQKVRKNDTIEGYEAYLKTHENEKYVKKARARLEELSFAEARKQDVFEAYCTFLERFPFGTFSKEAEKRAEDIRSTEMGIHLYRNQPEDYLATMTGNELAFRVMIKVKNEKGRDRESEIQWFEELHRKDLLVPMDPRKTHLLKPDIAVDIRESMVIFHSIPWALVEAEVWVRGALVKSYKIAGDHVERYLLYELFKDRGLYQTRLQIPTKEREAVTRDFDRLLQRLPLPGSLAIEYELHTSGSEWDHAVIQEFLGFLEDHPLYRDFYLYLRGHPPSRISARKAFMRVDPETHFPVFSIDTQFGGERSDWSTWNSKRIMLEKDFFFKQMALDIVAALGSVPPLKSRSFTTRPASMHSSPYTDIGQK